MNKDFALPSSQCLQNLHSMVVFGWPTITYLPQYHSFNISPIDTPSFHEGMKYNDMPPGHQPATPRFLLSLLVIVIYLSIPRIASQALGYCWQELYSRIWFLIFDLFISAIPLMSQHHRFPEAFIYTSCTIAMMYHVHNAPLTTMVENSWNPPKFYHTWVRFMAMMKAYLPHGWKCTIIWSFK